MLYLYVSTKNDGDPLLSADLLAQDDIDVVTKLVNSVLKNIGRELAYISNVPLDQIEEQALMAVEKHIGRKIFMVLSGKFAEGISFGVTGDPMPNVTEGEQSITHIAPLELEALEATIANVSVGIRSVLDKCAAVGYTFGRLELEKLRRKTEQN